MSRNSHIPENLSITSLESIFCDSRSQRRPATPTFQMFSITSHLESIFYRQLAESRDFTEIALKLNAKNPDAPNSEIPPRAYVGSSRQSPDEDNYRDSGLDETESRMTTLGWLTADRGDGDAVWRHPLNRAAPS